MISCNSIVIVASSIQNVGSNISQASLLERYILDDVSFFYLLICQNTDISGPLRIYAVFRFHSHLCLDISYSSVVIDITYEESNHPLVEYSLKISSSGFIYLHSI